MVRAGAHGEQEQFAIQHDIVTIGWNELPDISAIKDKEGLKKLYVTRNPEAKGMRLVRIVGQIWDFAKEIHKGDLVALPLKKQSAIMLGLIEGDYEYKELKQDIKHIRQVKWLKTIPRSEFDQDILFSLGAFSTVCEIKRNDAENRVKSMLGKPTGKKESEKYLRKEQQSQNVQDKEMTEALDLEQAQEIE